MDNKENILSEYIDDLNREKKPENDCYGADPELARLCETVKAVKTLKEPALPEEGYAHRLAQKVALEMAQSSREELNEKGAVRLNKRNRTARRKPVRPGWLLPAATALAACVLIFAMFVSRPGIFHTDVALAMQQAVGQLSSYHGVLEMRSHNEAGQEWLVRQVELWSEGDKYAIKQSDGTLTVNNGRQKWQLRPQKQEVALLPLLPDPARQGFDLRDEAARALSYPHQVVGSEVIAGRQASKMRISPPGGLEYYLWVDKETDLPIQLQTAMQNALQTTYTFVSFEANTQIDPGIFDYQLPPGFKVADSDPGQIVSTVEEAAEISGFIPLLPEESPSRILAFASRIVLDYGDTTIVEKVAQGVFEPAANSALGTAAGGPLEVWGESLRWRQDGIEIQVSGAQRAALAAQIAPGLALPEASRDLAGQARVKVAVDMDIVKADQQQADRGSSPWQLDPLQVSLTFVNLKVSPEGIVGEPQIGAASFKTAINNGVQAVVEVSAGPVSKVYLKRLVRQDETGIWSVVGYDPR
ncbi:MAG TPA: hypothetical protein DER60_00660 [Syntrophomonas sp.]|nr:hypothetical protein [Syntrophomonas sp.]